MLNKLFTFSVILQLSICNLSVAKGVRGIGIEQLPKNEFIPVNKAASGDSAALFIGVNEFNKDTGLAPLSCAVNDAIGQAHLFVRELKLIPAQNCILCVSGSPSTAIAAKQLELLRKDRVEVRSAAKSDILNSLTVATRMPVSTADMVIVSVSSHGFEDKDSIYVMPADGLRSYLSDTAIRSKVLSDTISKSRAGKKIVILDACRERVGKNKSSGSGAAMTENFLRAFAAGRGQITLTSCGIGQFSYEDEKSGHGVFSSFLLKGLRGSADSDDNGFVTVGSLSKYVADGVRRWIVRNKPDVEWSRIPQPRLDASETARMMPLAIAGDISGEKLLKARKYWQNYSISEGQSTHTVTTSGAGSNSRDLTILKEYYLDGRIERQDYELAEVLLKTEEKFLDFTDKELISAYKDVTSGRHNPERLSRLLGLVEETASRNNRKSAITKRIKVAELLSIAKANDSKANGKQALGVLEELLRLDPSHSQALSLQRKISGYYGPNPGDVMTNGIGMKLVWVPAGEFMMGSGLSASQVASQFGGKSDWFTGEHPQHQVKISKGFWMGRTEVTQSQYRAVMGTNPSHFKGDNNPVEQVSWNDAVEFCSKLSGKEGKAYTLPTEAQWEYACRAKSTTVFSFGNNESNLGDYVWYSKNSDSKTHQVGTKRPNGFGLYDMHGNVWEWCQDWYGKNYYSASPLGDPVGPDSGSYRVLRGGSWFYNANLCRSANRDRNLPGYRYSGTGFRVVLCVFSRDF